MGKLVLFTAGLVAGVAAVSLWKLHNKSCQAEKSAVVRPDPYQIKIICGNSNKKLASDIAGILGTTVIPGEVSKFADGELNIRIGAAIRGGDVYIIQPTCGPKVNDSIMELLLLIHTAKLCCAKRITSVIPYFGYARQDRKTKPRVPISASAMAQLIESQKPDLVVTVELHHDQIQGFFQNIPVDNLFAENVFRNHMVNKNFHPSEICIVSPDAGGVPRARRLADKLQAASVVTILKRQVNKVDEVQIVGEYGNHVCIIFDDLIDTADELVQHAIVLKKGGAKAVYLCATHGVFSGNALDLLDKSIFEEICVTDTIPQEENVKKCSKLTVLTMAPLLAETIRRLHLESSLEDIYSTYARGPNN